MNAPAPTGTLYLVPTPLDHGCAETIPLDDVLPLRTLKTAAALRHWVVENAKSTRAFLKRVDSLVPLAQPVQAQQIHQLPRAAHKKGDHGPAAAVVDARVLLAPALHGHDIGLASEAGMPAIADPGSSVVRAAHDLGIPVVPLVGPTSIVLALAASGLNGQNFAFVGYLPQDVEACETRIRELETLARVTGQTQLFIETPYRNAKLLGVLLRVLSPSTRLSVCSGATLPSGLTQARSVAEWRAIGEVGAADAMLMNTPSIFAVGP